MAIDLKLKGRFRKMEYRRKMLAKLTFLIREQIMPKQLIKDLFI